MTASITEIAKNSNEAVTVATGAVKATASAHETITKLGQSGAEIGEVIKVITSIAQQTNLKMNRNVTDAARGSNEIAESITAVAKTASGTATAANDTLLASRKLASLSSDLNHLIGQFKFESSSESTRP